MARRFGSFALVRWGARSNPLQKSTNRFDTPVSVRLSIDIYRRVIAMQFGTVKFYNDQKGYGFIQPEDGSKDVFVHATALERAGMRALTEGQKVSFDTQEDRRSGKLAVGAIENA